MDFFARTFNEIYRASGAVITDWKSDPSCRLRMRRMAGHYARGLRKLHIARASKELSHKRIFWLAESPSSYICMLVLAARRKRRSFSFTELVELARPLHARQPVGEGVIVREKINPHGKARTVVISGLLRTALQRMGRDIVSALHDPSPCDFGTLGRGRNSAASTLLQAMDETGSTHVVIGDMKRFFPSVSRAHLDGLVHLPAAMREAMFFVEEGAAIEHSKKSRGSTLEDLNQSVRSGLPQGSLASPVVAALVMANLMKDLPALWAGTYVDDFALLVLTAPEAEAIKDTLQKRVSALPAGPLVFKSLESYNLADKAIQPTFLGYDIKIGLEGQARATPCQTSFDKFYARLASRLKGTVSSNLMEEAERQAVAWMHSQAAADWNEAATDYFVGLAMLVALTEIQTRNFLSKALPLAA